jgi:secreted trypsin-like serine protease
MSQRAALALLLAPGLASCIDAPDHVLALGEERQPIVGGTDVAMGDWPDAVVVIGNRGTCSGTLIAPDVVLTAGHCSGIEPTQVIANTIDYARPGGVRAGVARTIAHPDWENTYDVSVVILASPITSVIPRNVGASCTFNALHKNSNVHLVGFGVTNMQGTAANSHLKEALAAVTDPVCSGGNGCNPGVAPGGEFVAGGTGTADSCFGDSGGPVYLDTPTGPVLIGAVSRGVNNSATPCGGGGIYVRTDKILSWIEAAAARTIAKDDCAGSGSDTYDGDAGSGDDDSSDQYADLGVGCAATGGGNAGAIVLVVIAFFAYFAFGRRRRC